MKQPAVKLLRYSRHRADAAAVLALFVLAAVAGWNPIFANGGTVVGMDAATQYYPWYAHLGERLRAGDVPGWNPYQFSGAPFAADPLSGWAYLPAMLLFTALPPVIAMQAYLFVHPLLASLFAYALARSLNIKTAGALLAAIAYGYGSYLYVQNSCCFAYVSVAVWLPLALLGVEKAIRSTSWTGRGLWWGVSGVAISQLMASWLGQGSYYALLALGGFVAYRTLFSAPDDTVHGLRGRFARLALHGGAILFLGFGLAAAGVLPRLEYNALSNLAGGYPGEGSANRLGLSAGLDEGWTTGDWRRLLEPGLFYVGAPVLALALAAPFVARGRSGGRFCVPYFGALSVSALILSGQSGTPLHALLYLLPYFDRLHPHGPQRAMLVFYLGVALLAGATLSALLERSPTGNRILLAALPALAALPLITGGTSVELNPEAGPWEAPVPLLLRLGIPLPPGPLLALALMCALAATVALLPARGGRLAVMRGGVALLVALVVSVDLLAGGAAAISSHADSTGGTKLTRLDLATYHEPTATARFLQSRNAVEGPSRYLGYHQRVADDKSTIPYTVRFTDPDALALEANNRATLAGLESVQGYNAVQPARYAAYLRALNTRPQNYHDADVFEEGLGSPLLDLLGVRHIVVPAEIPAGENPFGLARLKREYPVVYRDEKVEILQNPEALPRAWIVHSVRRANAREALELLSSGAVDPRRTALLEGGPPPRLEEPRDPTADRAWITSREPDSLSLQTATDAPGLLVLSEVKYPAWKAYVDGGPAPLRAADGLLRAVPIPAGEHTVELRYESGTLRWGIAISLTTAAALLTLAAFTFIQRRRRSAKG